MQLPDRITSEYLLERVEELEKHLGVRLLMLSNSYRRKAIYIRQDIASPGVMLTPGYIGNRELACWMSGVWMTHDQGITVAQVE